MLSYLKPLDARARLNLVYLCVFLLVALLMGGASRGDVPSQPFVRLAAIALIAICALQLDRGQWRQVRPALLFLAAIGAAIAIQLIPLPPGLWGSLPGRTLYVGALEAARIEPVWRPLSLTPDLTLNALLAVLPPMAAAIAVGTLDRAAYPVLVPILIVGILLSALVGILQISGGGLYFYRITNEGSAVGLFANRNHQALFLSMGFPLLAAWALSSHADPAYRRVRGWLALCVAAGIFPILLVSGSRAGLVLGAAGALAALLLVFIEGGRRLGGPLRRLLLILVPVLLIAGMIALTIYTSRDEAVQRLAEGQEFERRAEFLPIYIQMARDFFPFGAGYGSFDPIFRHYEPTGTLRYTYLNQAHNDLMQIVIEGGLLAVLLLVAFIAWFAKAVWRVWFQDSRSPTRLAGRAATIMAALILAGSLVDYPLRTPLMAVMMAIICTMLLRRSQPQAPAEAQKDDLAQKQA